MLATVVRFVICQILNPNDLKSREITKLGTNISK